MIDLALWLSPLDGENPSGEDLRNDPRFHEIERLVEPQTKVTYDERNKPTSEVVIPADWGAILGKAEELRGHGRDLRLIVLVTRALTNESGFAGLAQGLTLIRQTIEEHWETVHPSLRRNAPPREAALRRINALVDLQNVEGLLADLRQKAFFEERPNPPVTGRDLEFGTLDDRTVLLEASKGLSAKEQAALLEKHGQLVMRVRASCAAHADKAAGAMSALQDSARDAIAALALLDDAMNAKLESSGPQAPDLKRFLDRAVATLERAQTVQPGEVIAQEDAATATPTPLVNGHAPSVSTFVSSVGLPDKINSRDEVVKCLDLVVAFYDRTEPSSPIPHLARRVRKMVHMDFVELMEDLAPSGLKEFRLLAGIPDGKKAPQKDERS
ncbi:MAG: type VI secretion system protein TssA [Rhizobiaceae bacterium]